MLQEFSLNCYSGLGEIEIMERHIFWDALAPLKNLRTFALDLEGERSNSRPARELLKSVTKLTQISWVSGNPMVPSAHILHMFNRIAGQHSFPPIHMACKAGQGKFKRLQGAIPGRAKS